MTEPSPRAEGPVPAIDSAGPALLAAIVDSSDDAIVSKTLDGQVRSWNAAATRIFGYEPHEIIGRPITTIIPEELLEEEREIISRLRRGERVDHYDTIRVAKDGRRIPISLTISPVRNASGEIIGASKVARDISERRRAEEMLREAARRKDEFLAVLAHELRNPLAPIRFALELANHPSLSTGQQDAARAIVERQVAHMTRLLDDLLDVSRITSGKIELKKQPTELKSIIAAAIETARPALEERRHRLQVTMPSPPINLVADPIRLAQVFSNLLINAAKFTMAEGEVDISIAQEASWVVVSVRDNGRGISAEMMPRLFTMFSQAPGVHAPAEGGLGVGLSLVRGLVDMHGGSVEAHSAGAGLGSEFVVRLPIDGTSAADALRSTAAKNMPRGALRVLVVDDNHDAADCCKVLLEMAGHRIDVAYSGMTALELGERMQPQAVLLDIGLPDLDGYEVARRMRSTDWGMNALLVAVTGWGQARDRQRALEAGFDRHVTKPIAPEYLETLLGPVGPDEAHDLH
jgi:two-component system, chemotaxis family, CheB/CheR fusion protein